MKVKTGIRKSLNGHQVYFTIGNQTFLLQECEPEENMTSHKYAKWYQKMLNIAFENLLKTKKS